MIQIFVDPGEKGGVAWLNVDTGEVGAEKMPDTPAGLARLLKALPDPREATIEKVNAMPAGGKRKMGATSAFSFGKGVGHIEMGMACYDIPLREVMPVAWQKRIPGTPTKPPLDIPGHWTPAQAEKAKDEAAARYKAARKQYYKEYTQRLYPHIKVTLMTADALCMLSAWPGRIADDCI
jgi:hypothetical protein